MEFEFGAVGPCVVMPVPRIKSIATDIAIFIDIKIHKLGLHRRLHLDGWDRP